MQEEYPVLSQIKNEYNLLSFEALIKWDDGGKHIQIIPKNNTGRTLRDALPLNYHDWRVLVLSEGE